jgi:hypothetical protein
VTDLCFSKDGKLLASASADHTVRIWNGNGDGPNKVFGEAPDWNYAVAISPDDKFVAAAGADGAVRVWEIGPGALRGTLIAAPARKDAHVTAEWAVLTPSGWFAASPGWAPKAQAAVSGAPLKQKGILQALLNPPNVLKTLHGEAVEAPKLAIADSGHP